MFETCYLHIGSQKTGSTSIQHTLKTYAGVLEQNGFHYPTFQANHAKLAIVATPDSARATSIKALDEYSSLEEAQQAARRAFEAACRQSQASTLILSSEHFSLLLEEGLRDFLDYLSGFAKTVIAIAYVRHPAALVISGAQQGLKSGQFALDNFDQIYGPVSIRERLELYSQVMGDGRMILRPFDRSQLQDGDVVQDILRVVGLAPAVAAQIKTVMRNESLSHEAARIADAWARQQIAAGTAPDVLSRRSFVRSLTKIGGGKFALSDAQNAAVREAVAPEAQILRERFGLTLPEPDLPRIDADWSQRAVEDLARVLYDLTTENQQLRDTQQKLRKRLAVAKTVSARSGKRSKAARPKARIIRRDHARTNVHLPGCPEGGHHLAQSSAEAASAILDAAAERGGLPR